jgi:hypothetical protein
MTIAHVNLVQNGLPEQLQQNGETVKLESTSVNALRASKIIPIGQ